MNDQIHGHEVIAMLLAAKQPYTRESLRSEMDSRFGAAARFYTCVAGGLTADELLAFLESRGKLTVNPDGLTINPADVCGG